MESLYKQGSDFVFQASEPSQTLPENLIANTRNFAKQFNEQ